MLKHKASKKYFLIKAIYDWCVACNYAPQLLVYYHPKCIVPKEFIDEDNEIAFSLNQTSIHNLIITTEYIRFTAFFDTDTYTPEDPLDICIPLECVKGIYEPQEGDGLIFQIDKQELINLDTKNIENTINKKEDKASKSILKRIK
jgi:stringent starvation protein B